MAVAQGVAIPRTLATRRVNPRALVGVALAVAGAALVLWTYRAQQPTTVDVLRAAHDVPAGVALQLEDLAPLSVALPDDVAATLVPATDRAALVGRTLAQPLNAGDLVTRRQAVPAIQRIADGFRVYTMPVGAEVAAGGQVSAGDEVEVVVTLGKNQPDAAQTQTVIPRAKVYAVGRNDSSADLFSASAVRSGTGNGQLDWLALLVDDAQFQALAKARWTGDLDVALLPPAQAQP